MIRTVDIKNFKSIPDMTLDLGRVTVLIGANGSGKSNVLEAIAFAAAAAQNKLDNEFLVSRGIRVTEAHFMNSAFQAAPQTSIWISVLGAAHSPLACELFEDKTTTYPKWRQRYELPQPDFFAAIKSANNDTDRTDFATMWRQIQEFREREVEAVGPVQFPHLRP